MKKIIIVALVLLCASFALSQDKVEIITEYYDSGKSETPYVNGQIHGVQVYSDNDGSYKSTTNYVNGVVDGISTSQFLIADEVFLIEIIYENGVKNGIEKMYQNGELFSETPYVDGKQGISKIYYKNVLKLAERDYATQHETWWYNNGNIAAKGDAKTFTMYRLDSSKQLEVFYSGSNIEKALYYDRYNNITPLSSAEIEILRNQCLIAWTMADECAEDIMLIF